MAEATGDAYVNNRKLSYPLTKMNFLVTVGSKGAEAAFNEVTGIEASVDVIEFRQGNAGSLAPVKVPGLVKHGNVTLKMGYTKDSDFKDWIVNCVKETRATLPRSNVTIELIDINTTSPTDLQTASSAVNRIWVLSNAWVTKYSAPDLNASTSEIAIESVELAYEELTIPN